MKEKISEVSTINSSKLFRNLEINSVSMDSSNAVDEGHIVQRTEDLSQS